MLPSIRSLSFVAGIEVGWVCEEDPGAEVWVLLEWPVGGVTRLRPSNVRAITRTVTSKTSDSTISMMGFFISLLID